MPLLDVALQVGEISFTSFALVVRLAMTHHILRRPVFLRAKVALEWPFALVNGTYVHVQVVSFLKRLVTFLAGPQPRIL